MRPARKGRSSVIVFIRAILLYLLIIFCLRLMGKRQLGELQPSELVITILISNIASLPIEDNSIPMIMGVVPIVVLVGFELIISSISLRSKRFRTLVSGKPMIIVRNGQIDQSAMKKLRFSIDDLMETLRGPRPLPPKCWISRARTPIRQPSSSATARSSAPPWTPMV